jgi:hypothetical protein
MTGPDPTNPSPVAHTGDADAGTSPIRWTWLLPRAVLLFALAWGDVRTLLDTETWNVFAGLTLAVHEGGHLLFGPFGEWLMIAGGSLTQILAPVIAAALLWRQGDRCGAGVVGTWLTYSLTNLAEYVGDARAMQLQLVGFSSDPIHDWHYLLASVHMLPYDTRLALLTRDTAWAVLLASVAFAAHVLTQGARRHIDPAPGLSADITPSA